MDPNAAYREWCEARLFVDKREYARALVDWLARGGFEPRWTEDQKREFFAWCHRAHV